MSYAYADEAASEFKSVSEGQKAAARFMLDRAFGSAVEDGFAVEGFTRLKVTETNAERATIRFAQSSAPDTAFAYYPGGSDRAGDVWFGVNYDYRSPVAGNYAWHTALHEIGHALGLKHAHEAEGAFQVLDGAYDTPEYTVMTYRNYRGGPTSGGYTYEGSGAPQTFMAMDILALQALYGANYETNAGDTVYRWMPGSGVTLVDGQAAIRPGANRIFATIWDGGGSDTYDLTAYGTNLQIDLRPGASSKFADAQTAKLAKGKYAAGNVFNAFLHDDNPASLIENASGGRGSDRITGNRADNVLRGNAGKDRLNGLEGKDLLVGGAGQDTLTGGADADHFRFDAAPGKSNVDTIADFNPLEDRIELENAVFTVLRQTGSLVAEFFAVVSGRKLARDGNDHVIYQWESGKLFYDRDGTGKSAAVQVAVLQPKLALTADDFVVI
jgi:serralysin